MKCNMKRKGFTLVELLIVIVVIGILSAMMMLSSTEAVTSARASNIVSNLRNLKTAALAMYVDNLDTFDGNKTAFDQITCPTGFNSWRDVLVKYLNAGGSSNTVDNSYQIKNVNGTWYVYVSSIGDKRVSEKLAGRAKSVGLLGSTYAQMVATDDEVNMWVLDTATTAATAAGASNNSN